MNDETEVMGIAYAEWKAYRKVQEGGRYNMIMDAAKAMRSARLDSGAYWFIINNYEALQKAFEGKEKNDDAV